jgi:hypothetical protein
MTIELNMAKVQGKFTKLKDLIDSKQWSDAVNLLEDIDITLLNTIADIKNNHMPKQKKR